MVPVDVELCVASGVQIDNHDLIEGAARHVAYRPTAQEHGAIIVGDKERNSVFGEGKRDTTLLPPEWGRAC